MNIKQRLYNSTFGYAEYLKNRHFSNSAGRIDNKILLPLLKSQNMILTNSEKLEIKEKWGKVIQTPIEKGFPFFRGLKILSRFSPDYLPTCYFYPFLLDILNPRKIVSLFEHKSLTQLLIGKIIQHPISILRTYGGGYLDSNYYAITHSKSVELLKSISTPVIMKPASGSSQGYGVRCYDNGDSDKLIRDFECAITEKRDIVIQQIVSQSNDTSVFNNSSLNCFRITTINIGSRVFVGSRALKCGAPDSHVDNIGNGKNGVIVGVDSEGYLSDFGFFGNGEMVSSHNGVKFQGYRIKNFDSVLNSAIQMHEQLGNGCAIVGWDIALDAENRPVLIEGNVDFPGIFFEQLCSGPIFGDYTDEVISYIRELQ